MKEKKTNHTACRCRSSQRLRIKKTSPDDGAADYRCRAVIVPGPEGLPAYAWHYFAIFVGVIVGLIFEPLPGAVIGITGVVVIALLQPVAAVQPDQMAAPGFKWLAPPFKWAVSGLATPCGLSSARSCSPPATDKTQFGRRLALILVKYLGRRSLTLGYAITFAGSAAGAVYAV